MPNISSVYRPRNPGESACYRCVEDHCERFEQAYEDRLERQYGFFRPYVKKFMYRYLDCGDPHNGFTRFKCNNCGREYLLALSRRINMVLYSFLVGYQQIIRVSYTMKRSELQVLNQRNTLK